jgi:hypothetical protein
MASFTDQIPKFNPYIQQLPVEAMVKVGMQKQAQYDAGVQKIQSQIDNIAGLDIDKSVQRQYLQSKLNELGNNLTTVAAGDFSNFQLVNSVGGMVNQISKDPVIQNAVSSTKWKRDQQAIQQKAKQEGKSSAQNDDDFNEKMNSWLNDGDVKSVFRGEYIPYTNMDEKLRKVYKDLKEQKNSADIPWKTDDQGNVLFFKKDDTGKIVSASTDPRSGGEKELDISMKRIKTSGITSQRILNNFMSSLTENDKRQLMIDAKYHYKGMTKETLKSDFFTTVNSQKKMLHENLVDMAVELQNNDKLTDEERQAYEAAIADGNVKLSNGTFEKIYAQGIVGIDNISDLNKYKYQVYTEKTLTNLAQDLQVINREEQIVSNPIYRAVFDQQKFKFQVEKSEAQLKIQTARLAIAQRNQLLREEQWAVKLKEKRAKAEEDAEIDNPITYDLEGDAEKYRINSETLKSDARSEMLLGVGNLNNEYGSRIFSTTKGQQAQKDALDKLYLDYLANPTKLQNSDALTYIRQRKAIEANYDNASKLGTAASEYARKELVKLGGNLTRQQIDEKTGEFEADYISKRLAKESGGVYAGLNPEGKATKKALKSVIGNKLEQFRTEGSVGAEGKVDENGLTLIFSNIEKSVPVLRRNDDGSGVLSVNITSGEGNKKSTVKQVIPLSPEEMFMHFPKFAPNSAFGEMKKSMLYSGTTNSFGTRNAGGARIFGFDIPGLVGTGFDITTRFDIEPNKNNSGGAFETYKLIMYSLKNGVWKPGEVTNYVGENEIMRFLREIGPGTVKSFNQKN